MRTRQRSRADEAAGHPPSPAQSLPITTRRVRLPKSRAPTKKSKESSTNSEAECSSSPIIKPSPPFLPDPKNLPLVSTNREAESSTSPTINSPPPPTDGEAESSLSVPINPLLPSINNEAESSASSPINPTPQALQDSNNLALVQIWLPPQRNATETPSAEPSIRLLVHNSVVTDFLSSIADRKEPAKSSPEAGDEGAAAPTSPSASKRKLETGTTDTNPAMKRHKPSKHFAFEDSLPTGIHMENYDEDGNLVLGLGAFYSDTDSDGEVMRPRPQPGLLGTLGRHRKRTGARRAAERALVSTAAKADVANDSEVLAAVEEAPAPVVNNQAEAPMNDQALIVQSEVDRQALTQHETQAGTETPRNTRGWGLGSLIGSVSRFVPAIPVFGRVPTTQAQSNIGRSGEYHDTETVMDGPIAVAPPAPGSGLAGGARAARLALPSLQRESLPGPERPIVKPNSNARVPLAYNDAPAKNTSETHNLNQLSAPTNTFLRQTVSGPIIYPSKERREANRTLQNSNRKFLDSQQKLIDEEVARKVKEVLEEQERLRTEAEKATMPGAKRKRLPSPEVIPNPPGCSYGMDLDYFASSSSEDEMDDGESPNNQPESPSARPAKRARMSSESQTTPPARTLGDPYHAPPYTGTLFADPKPNVFEPVQPSITFTIPYGSDSESDNEDEGAESDSKNERTSKETADSASGLASISVGAPTKVTKQQSLDAFTSAEADPSPVKVAETWKQPPPPAPKPSHLELPSSTTAHVDTEALARVRARALQHTPKQPSGLRVSSRLSASTIATPSEIGDRDESIPDVSQLTDDQHREVLDEITGNEKQHMDKGKDKESSTTQKLKLIDPAVQEAIDSIPHDQLLQFEFPAASRGYAAMGFDPEVVAAVLRDFGQQDKEQAVRMFDSDFKSWSDENAVQVANGLV